MRILLLSLFLQVPAIGMENPYVSRTAAEKPPPPALSDRPAGKAQSSPVLRKPPARQPRTTEIELSGVSGTDYKSIYTRVRLERRGESRPWFLRTGYRLNRSITASGTRVISNDVVTMTIDSQIKSSNEPRYKYLALTANVRTRDPAGRFARRSGYFMPSIGIGWRFSPKFTLDLGGGILRDYDNGGENEPAMMLVLRSRHQLTDRIAFESDAFLINPLANKIKLDIDATISHQLTDALFLRVGWSGTNLIRPLNRQREWDSAYRIALLYRWTRR